MRQLREAGYDRKIAVYEISSGQELQFPEPNGYLFCYGVWWEAQPDILVAVVEPEELYEGFACEGIPALYDVSGELLDIIGEEPTYSQHLSLSSDGASIAFNEGPEPSIYRIGEGSHILETMEYGFIELEGAIFSHPSWSPTGERIAWVVTAEQSGEGLQGIGIFDLQDEDAFFLFPYRVVGTYNRAYLRWSADGRYLYIENLTDNTFWILSADGEEAYQLQHSIEWSPKGAKYAYVSYDDDESVFSLNLVSLPGEAAIPIELAPEIQQMHEMGNQVDLIWGPDEESLIVVFKTWQTGLGNWLVDLASRKASSMNLPEGSYVTDWLDGL
jgi:Tol biopolymer transport system component